MVPNQVTSLRFVPEKYMNEKFLLQALQTKYKIKFRTWKIMADENQIGVVTSASRPILKNGKIDMILIQFSFLSLVDFRVTSKFEGHKTACLNLLSKKSFRVIPDPENPGKVKDQIKSLIILEIAKRKSFWLRKVWDEKSTAKIEIV